MAVFESTEEYFYGLLLGAFIDDFIFEECIDMMWRVRTNGCTVDELYNVDPLDTFFAQEKLSAGAQGQSNTANSTVSCPVCNEMVSGRRFAPHLERCMNGGKRGSKRHYDFLHDDYGSRSLVKPKSSDALDQADLHPKSLIIRMQLRNGVPRTNQKRLGASTEDFAAGEIGKTQFRSLYQERGLLPDRL